MTAHRKVQSWTPRGLLIVAGVTAQAITQLQPCAGGAYGSSFLPRGPQTEGTCKGKKRKSGLNCCCRSAKLQSSACHGIWPERASLVVKVQSTNERCRAVPRHAGSPLQSRLKYAPGGLLLSCSIESS